MLGDKINSILSLVGITQERVEKWLGKPCNCKERIEKLNQLDLTIRQMVKSGVSRSVKYLESLLNS